MEVGDKPKSGCCFLLAVVTVMAIWTHLLVTGQGTNVVNTRSEAHPLPNNLRDLSIYSCGDKVFAGQSLDLLFPPSEAVLPVISNIVQAAAVHNRTLETFCSNYSAYSECVQRTLRNPVLPGDRSLRKILDVDNFKNVMANFCDERALIASQFICTYESLQQVSCNGGLYEILRLVEREAGKFYFCTSLRIARLCRVDRQLRQCNAQYADIMNSFYMGLLKQSCRDEIVPSDTTDLQPCVMEYTSGMRSRLGHEEPSDHAALFDAISTEADHICKDAEQMTSCISTVLSFSNKTMDRFLMKLLTRKQFQGIVNMTCKVKSVIQTHGRCLGKQIITEMDSTDNCFNSTIEAIFDGMNIKQPTDDNLESASKVVCREIVKVGECVKKMLKTCNSQLSKVIAKLSVEVTSSCHNPKYKLFSHQKDKKNGGTCLTVYGGYMTMCVWSVLALVLVSQLH